MSCTAANAVATKQEKLLRLFPPDHDMENLAFSTRFYSVQISSSSEQYSKAMIRKTAKLWQRCELPPPHKQTSKQAIRQQKQDCKMRPTQQHENKIIGWLAVTGAGEQKHKINSNHDVCMVEGCYEIRLPIEFWTFFCPEIWGSVWGPHICCPIVPFFFRSKVIGSGVRRSKFYFCMGFSMEFFCGPKKRYFFKKVAGHILTPFLVCIVELQKFWWFSIFWT